MRSARREATSDQKRVWARLEAVGEAAGEALSRSRWAARARRGGSLGAGRDGYSSWGSPERWRRWREPEPEPDLDDDDMADDGVAGDVRGPGGRRRSALRRGGGEAGGGRRERRSRERGVESVAVYPVPVGWRELR